MLFVFLPLALLLTGLYVYGRLGLPPREQTLQVPGGGTVKIVRDEHGVPRLFANRDEDVYFAMGYVQAQDRLWQMELERRLASGRLSEIFGKDLLAQDSWMRTLGLRQSAQSAYSALSGPARSSLTAYARGVNAWLSERHPLPFEFTMFNVHPGPWTEIDSLAWSKVFALDLAGNLDQEIGKAAATHYLLPEQVQFFFPGKRDTSSEEAPTPTLASLASLGTFAHNLHLNWQIGGREVGSNAWVVSGRYTLGGGALLANDPHLGLQLPSIWYPVVQHGDRLRTQGMSLVGLPVVIFGQNGRIAWGGTSMMADVQDLAIERFDPNDPNRYLADGKWVPVEQDEEQIAVAPDFPAFLHQALKPVQIEVRHTRNGPIISDLRGKAIGQPVALRWTALQKGDRSYESMYAVSYAEDWTSFRESFRHYVAPALNMLYADRNGNIGYLGIGQIPIRQQGDGSLPEPGWDSAFAWQSYIPFDAMPMQYNPPEGYIVSANDRPVSDSYPYFISNDWAPPARADRIKQMLQHAIASGHPLTIKDMQVIQTDVVSLSARHLLPQLTALAPSDADERQALDLLRNWSGNMTASSTQAAIFNVWTRHLADKLFGDALVKDWTRRQQQQYVRDFLEGARIDQIDRALTDEHALWCRPQALETDERACRRLLRVSLDEALSELHKRLGGNETSWHWGAIHHTLYAHQPFSNIKGLSWIFERRVESGGGPDCIDVSGFYLSGTDGYVGAFGPSSRQLIELGPHGSQYEYMNSTGQSGNWMNPHYADMVLPFMRGQYFSLEMGGGK
ncbi:penicillin acylase family protein [Dyella humi]|uniref:penicillin acylase family protein n=1 Tax=Dyella humi TaxID=1770547 RepID=UPI0036089956